MRRKGGLHMRREAFSPESVCILPHSLIAPQPSARPTTDNRQPRTGTMRGGLLWEPASAKEAAYYDTIFENIDLDKSGTLDDQEAVKFLSLSGLTKSQLKNVWSLAISPGQITLQRNEFYVAMRAVALAQNGEDTPTPERVRETATDAVKIATFKGGAKPPISSSKGKKAKKESTWFSKTTPGSNKGAVPTKRKTWFSKTAPGSNKGVVPRTTPPTSGLTKKVEDGAGSSSRAKVAVVHSTKNKRGIHKKERDNGEGPDPFSMTEEARARYAAIFNKADDTGAGYLSGRQVAGLFAKSSLDKKVLEIIWRLSDLDQDGHLAPEEFSIALHLIFCATEGKIDVPNELPPSLWPDGYVPPSVVARREEEAKRKRSRQLKEAKGRRLREEGDVEPKEEAGAEENVSSAVVVTERTAENVGHGNNSSSAVGNVRDKNGRGGGRKKGKLPGDVKEKRKTVRGQEEEQEEQEEEEKEKEEKRQQQERHDRKTERGGNSPQHRKEVADERPKSKDGKKKNKTKDNTQVLQAAVQVDPPPRAEEQGSSAKGFVASAGNTAEEENLASGTKAKARKKKKRSPPESDHPAPTDRLDAGGADGGGLDGDDSRTVGPLSPAERRDRKTRARAARMEELRLKKEEALRDERLEKLDHKDDYKSFTLKAMDPMHTSQDDNSIHNLSFTGDGTGGRSGGLSLAKLSAPLPHLTPHPGREPCLRTQQFSVSFPSGVRRASSLTASLEVRLGPPKPSPPTGCQDISKIGLDGRGDVSRKLRCPECAEFVEIAQIERHIRSTCRLLPCALCSRLILPAARERHLEDACPNRRRDCTRCGEPVMMSNFANHEKDGSCARRVVPCEACGDYCFADELRRHEERQCHERQVRCRSCGDSLPARQLDEHASLLCRKNSWTCACGQGPLPLVERRDHLKNCEAFVDAWEASIEKVIARMPKIEVVRSVGKVMISTRIEDPEIALLAFAESEGDTSLAAKRMSDGRAYLDELCLAADIVNVGVFLRALKKPGKRGAGALWREGVCPTMTATTR